MSFVFILSSSPIPICFSTLLLSLLSVQCTFCHFSFSFIVLPSIPADTSPIFMALLPVVCLSFPCPIFLLIFLNDRTDKKKTKKQVQGASSQVVFHISCYVQDQRNIVRVLTYFSLNNTSGNATSRRNRSYESIINGEKFSVNIFQMHLMEGISQCDIKRAVSLQEIRLLTVAELCALID